MYNGLYYLLGSVWHGFGCSFSQLLARSLAKRASIRLVTKSPKKLEPFFIEGPEP